MSTQHQFHFDYALVQKTLSSVSSIDKELINNDELIRKLTYLIDNVRREVKRMKPMDDSEVLF